jgi:hypothetical protein
VRVSPAEFLRDGPQAHRLAALAVIARAKLAEGLLPTREELDALLRVQRYAPTAEGRIRC